MTEQTLAITIFYSDVVELERAVLVNGLGLLRSIRAEEIIPDEAEGLLFKPGIRDKLQRQGVSEEIIDFIEKGFFLDDVLRLSGTPKLRILVDDMEELALQLLAQRPLKRYYAWALPTKQQL